MKHQKIKRIFTKIKTPIMLFAALATTVTISTMFAPTDTKAWGPTDRPTYTNEKPADYATFNSITNNVAVGDERNFVRIREAGTENTFVDELEIVPGHEYEVYIYYHNNAASDTNEKGYGVATNTRVASAYPTIVNSNERGMVSGIITWSYVTPSAPNTPKDGKVWDEAYITSKTDGVVLKYKTGSAIIHNSGEANGSVLPYTLFTNEGTPIGFNKLGGTLPGCAEYSGHITYTLIAENPGSELSKQVSTDGENWFNNVTVKPGDFVTYKVMFKNTGNTNFTNLILTDSHDADLLLRSGSTKVYDYEHADGYTIDDIIDISGHNTGDIHAGGLTQLIYQMQVKEDSSTCGKTLNNTITANFNSTETKTAGAEVSVNCEDQPTPPPSTTEDCNTNPNLPGCQQTPSRIVDTGPVEIAIAAAILIGIGGAVFYLVRTRRTLKTVEDVVTGDTKENITPEQANGPVAPAGFSTPADQITPAEPASTSDVAHNEEPLASAEPVEPETTAPSEPTQFNGSENSSEPAKVEETQDPSESVQPEETQDSSEPTQSEPAHDSSEPVQSEESPSSEDQANQA